MIDLIKKHKVLLLVITIPNIVILLLCTIRTNMEITINGGITNVNSVISIDSANKAEGSFNTTYVRVMSKSTPFQNILCNWIEEFDVEEISSSYTHLTDGQQYDMGIIQKNQSIESSLIASYNMANLLNTDINLVYSYEGQIVRYINKYSNFQIGDIIVSVNGITVDQIDEFNVAFKNYKIDDHFEVIRNEKKVDVKITESNYKSFLTYDKFDINYDDSFPKINIKSSTSLGPSGGLLQSLSVLNSLIDDDLTNGLLIAGTGTINYMGEV
ncbi:MAG: hypothetical protein ACRC5M_06165, partial [Anaeroplasmataceae bacterium]